MLTKSVLSNVDLIRRYVFKHQPVRVDEIAQAVLDQMESVKDVDQARERYVLPVLKAHPYYRQNGEGQWEIIQEQMPEYRALPLVLQEEHCLLYEREVRSKVAAKLRVKVYTIVLDLTKAPELKQFGNHWGLSKWVLVNDQAAEILRQHAGGMSERDLIKHVCDRFGLSPDAAVFHLAGDKQKRFVQDRKLWFVKEEFEKQKTRQQEKAAKLPEIKIGAFDKALEGSFLTAQSSRSEDSREDPERAGKSRLKKALKKQVAELIEQREEHKPEDLAVKLSQVLTAAGIDEYGVTSFQRVESAAKDRGLSHKERDEIQQFLDQLLAQETVGVGASLPAVVNAPLSARKVGDVLRLKYIGYTRDRAVIPPEYQRLLVELIKPRLDMLVLHPACFDGQMTVELLSYLFDHLDGAAWTLTEDGDSLEIVQPDGARYSLPSKDAALLEQARDKFIVSQLDLLSYFINYNYTGIEPDRVLVRAARVTTRLSGFEGVYVVSRDLLSELPEVFGLPPNAENSIPTRFDLVTGNFTFTQEANLAASYLEQAIRLLKPNGRLAVFVLQDLLTLLKKHALLGDFFRDLGVTHFLRLPMIEGRHKVVLLVGRSLAEAGPPPQIVTAEIADFKAANSLLRALSDGTGAGELYKKQEQMALGNLIGA